MNADDSSGATSGLPATGLRIGDNPFASHLVQSAIVRPPSISAMGSADDPLLPGVEMSGAPGVPP